LLVGALLVAAGANYYFGKWAVANMASSHTDIVEVAELATRLGPDDPQTHFAAAVLYEESFQPDDISRSLDQYATATALSPNNYLFWLGLGNARVRDGNLKGAEEALRIAADLAPNCGSVRWPLGNVLLRLGRTEEAFVEMRRAAQTDPEYAAAAADIAWQYFNGDVQSVRSTIGDSPEIIGALIARMASQKRIDEALLLWNTLPAVQKDRALKPNGRALYAELIAVKRFRDAFRVNTDMFPEDAKTLKIGDIENGDFESEIKLHDASVFEWTIADGTQPQVVLTDGNEHGGERSLLLVFNSVDANAFRSISQTVAVEPGQTYSFEAFYRSDITSQASVLWEIVDASDGKILAKTPPAIAASGWTLLSESFSVPTTTDGVIIRLAKTTCITQNCPITGQVWLDDIHLHAK